MIYTIYKTKTPYDKNYFNDQHQQFELMAVEEEQSQKISGTVTKDRPLNRLA